MYLYEHSDWPNFTVDESLIDPIEKRIKEKALFLDGIMSVISDRKVSEAESIAETLKNSWSIEGVELSDGDIYSSVAKRLDLPYVTRNTKTYYDGIVDVLLDAVENHNNLTLDRLFSWHRKIVEDTPGIKKGCFRDDDVYIVSGSLKNTQIIYEAPKAGKVPAMIYDFLEFVNGRRFSLPVLAAIAQYYFVAIHPFEDGNGREARIISDYILSMDSSSLPSTFISKEIKMKRAEYYRVLDETSKGSSLDVTPWVVWFLECLLSSYERTIAKIQKSFQVKAFFERADKYDLNERQQKFLSKVLDDEWKGAITAKKYAAITSCHIDTANRDLKKMVKDGLLKQEEGGSKNTHYSIKF